MFHLTNSSPSSTHKTETSSSSQLCSKQALPLPKKRAACTTLEQSERKNPKLKFAVNKPSTRAAPILLSNKAKGEAKARIPALPYTSHPAPPPCSLAANKHSTLPKK